MVQGAKRLRAFLSSRGISFVRAGEALEISGPSVHAWVTGDSRPKSHLRDAIEVWTRGEVPASSWDTAEERRARTKVRPDVPA